MNMSMTADGKIATTNRVVSSFSSKRDHNHLLSLRATADAVMCGARTVDLNKVNLGPGGPKYRKLRLKRGLVESNLRIIVSGSGTLDPNAHIFRNTAASDKGSVKNPSPIIILTSARAGKARIAKLRAVANEVKVFGKKRPDLRAALKWLHQKWNVRRLICEGGGELNDAMFRAGLVDELYLTLCPRIIGGSKAPTIADGLGFPKLAKAEQLKLKTLKQSKNELFLTYTRDR